MRRVATLESMRPFNRRYATESMTVAVPALKGRAKLGRRYAAITDSHFRLHPPHPPGLTSFGESKRLARGGFIHGIHSIFGGEQVPVHAQIGSMESFSGHADSREILRWLKDFQKPPKLAFIVHGESGASEALADQIHRVLGWKTHIPAYLETAALV